MILATPPFETFLRVHVRTVLLRVIVALCISIMLSTDLIQPLGKNGRVDWCQDCQENSYSSSVPPSDWNRPAGRPHTSWLATM